MTRLRTGGTGIGSYRHRVAFERVGTTRDAAGQVVQTWTAVATIWAAVDPLTSREYWSAEQVKADVTHTIRFRSGAVDVGPADRALWDERYFHLEPPVDDGVEVKILAKEAA